MRDRVKSAIADLVTAGKTDRARFLEQAALQAERDRLIDRIAATMPENPVLQGAKVYSQCDEDGIVAEIFRRIGTQSKVTVEFGCGDGLENNTHALLLKGWRGLWSDGAERNLARLRDKLDESMGDPTLLICGDYVTLENIEAIAGAACDRFLDSNQRIDFLSMDLDGNDLHFLRRLVHLRPRVVCAEYNAALGPDIVASVAYDPDHTWAGDDYMGASLAALCDVMEAADYKLVCCNLSGANAFFVDVAESGSFGDYAPAQLYQPARYHFIFLADYHPRSLRFLAQTCLYEIVDLP